MIGNEVAREGSNNASRIEHPPLPLEGQPYSFKSLDERTFCPTVFPEDALASNGLPKSIRRVKEFIHGDPVCVVVCAANQRIFSGGQGTVKIWDNSNPSAPEQNDSPLATLHCLNERFIRCCQLTSDSKTLIVAGETPAIAVWDLEKRLMETELPNNTANCFSLALSHDERLLYAGCGEGTITVWDVRNKTLVGTLLEHEDGVTCLETSDNGYYVSSGSLDKNVYYWDFRTKRVIHQHQYPGSVSCLNSNPDREWMTVGMFDGQISVLNSGENPESYMLHLHDKMVLGLCFASNGEWFVSAGQDGFLNAWRSPYGASLFQVLESNSLLSCTFADDEHIVLGCGNNKAIVYEVSYED